LDIVKYNLGPSQKLFAPSSVPSWLRGCLNVFSLHVELQTTVGLRESRETQSLIQHRKREIRQTFLFHCSNYMDCARWQMIIATEMCFTR